MKLKTGYIDTVIAETKCVQAAALVVQGITPVSSKAPTEVAAAVVPVVWASGIAEEWKRAEPVGENGESGQEEEKPRDSSLSPRQPMNCLPGNGRMGWTLDCSLWMRGTPGTPGAAWADGLDAPAPPFLPGHWVRVEWWDCQPLQRDVAWKLHRAEPRDLKVLTKGGEERRKKGTEAAAKQHQVPV
ncbi:uncharacterized protein LOC127482133 isoform X2 [Manacus candei]|uniref:uncharacterized protein LOC127482133 isoform X2 n=1 Tax=Manacus candei TaxID=415023 RepID=UPI002227C769|nr:uncharacterized protein LOC127482133 isoform X2 [Manacus candei]